MIQKLRHLRYLLLEKHRRKTQIAVCVLFVAFWFCLPKPLFNDPTSMVLEANDGALLDARIASDGQWRFPPSDTLPEKFETCLIEFEDRSFYYHPGVNPFSLGRAIIQNLKNQHVVSGGSTLTMQTIRMARRNQARTILTKLVESTMAMRLEVTYTKRSILLMYASNAPFGGNVVGIDAASWRYFGKSPKHSLGQNQRCLPCCQTRLR